MGQRRASGRSPRSPPIQFAGTPEEQAPGMSPPMFSLPTTAGDSPNVRDLPGLSISAFHSAKPAAEAPA
eukprot:3057612-Pyramimonas_sp.AAC.1